MGERSPGPWAYDGPEYNIHVFQEKRPYMRICFLTSDGPTEANARLIAASPDLLEACRAVVKLHNYRGEDVDGFVAEVEAQLKAAIAKAEGV